VPLESRSFLSTVAQSLSVARRSSPARTAASLPVGPGKSGGAAGSGLGVLVPRTSDALGSRPGGVPAFISVAVSFWTLPDRSRARFDLQRNRRAKEVLTSAP